MLSAPGVPCEEAFCAEALCEEAFCAEVLCEEAFCAEAAGPVSVPETGAVRSVPLFVDLAGIGSPQPVKKSMRPRTAKKVLRHLPLVIIIVYLLPAASYVADAGLTSCSRLCRRCRAYWCPRGAPHYVSLPSIYPVCNPGLWDRVPEKLSGRRQVRAAGFGPAGRYVRPARKTCVKRERFPGGDKCGPQVFGRRGGRSVYTQKNACEGRHKR